MYTNIFICNFQARIFKYKDIDLDFTYGKFLPHTYNDTENIYDLFQLQLGFQIIQNKFMK